MSTKTEKRHLRTATSSLGELAVHVSQSGACADSLVLPDSSVAFAIWDARGHGAAAVSNTLLTRAAFRTLFSANHDLSATCKVLNRLLYLRASGEAPWPSVHGLFVHVDPARKTLQYVSCGHDAAILFDSGTTHAHLASNAPSLGTDAASTFEPIVLALEKGRVLVAATRGVTNARPLGATDFFGVGRICSLVRPRLTDESADATWLMDEATRFSGGLLRDSAAVIIARVV